ncbi:hypothetical protein ACQRWP_20005 [Micromonospora trifolii]|uniref:hypothetical protein n=1 Tax=Micromonospora trifolii TaxID=2911208 RepID=UPI003D2EE833
MLGEYRRIMDSRKRGFDRFDYLLTLDELQQLADARVHPSNRPQRRGTSIAMHSGSVACQVGGRVSRILVDPAEDAATPPNRSLLVQASHSATAPNE